MEARSLGEQYLHLLKTHRRFIQHGDSDFFTCPDFCPPTGKQVPALSSRSFHALRRLYSDDINANSFGAINANSFGANSAASSAASSASSAASSASRAASSASNIELESRACRFQCLTHEPQCSKVGNPLCPARLLNHAALSRGKLFGLPLSTDNGRNNQFWQNDWCSVQIINHGAPADSMFVFVFAVRTLENFAIVTQRALTAQLKCRKCSKEPNSCIHVNAVREYYKQVEGIDIQGLIIDGQVKTSLELKDSTVSDPLSQNEIPSFFDPIDKAKSNQLWWKLLQIQMDAKSSSSIASSDASSASSDASSASSDARLCNALCPSNHLHQSLLFQPMLCSQCRREFPNLENEPDFMSRCKLNPIDANRPGSRDYSLLCLLDQPIRCNVVSVICPDCSHVNHYDGRDDEIFNYNNHFLFSHQLMNAYTNQFRTSDTRINAFHQQMTYLYQKIRPLLDEFPSYPIFIDAWFGFIKRQKWDYSFSCPECFKLGGAKKIVLDGVSIISPAGPWSSGSAVPVELDKRVYEDESTSATGATGVASGATGSRSSPLKCLKMIDTYYLQNREFASLLWKFNGPIMEREAQTRDERVLSYWHEGKWRFTNENRLQFLHLLCENGDHPLVALVDYMSVASAHGCAADAANARGVLIDSFQPFLSNSQMLWCRVLIRTLSVAETASQFIWPKLADKLQWYFTSSSRARVSSFELTWSPLVMRLFKALGILNNPEIAAGIFCCGVNSDTVIAILRGRMNSIHHDSSVKSSIKSDVLLVYIVCRLIYDISLHVLHVHQSQLLMSMDRVGEKNCKQSRTRKLRTATGATGVASGATGVASGATGVATGPPVEAFVKKGAFYGIPPIRKIPQYECDSSPEVESEFVEFDKKDFNAHRNRTGGLMICWCEHGVCLGFHVMPTSEGASEVFKLVYSRFETAPEVIVYDNACVLNAYCTAREPIFFANTKILIDRFHSGTSAHHINCSMCNHIRSYIDCGVDMGSFDSLAESGNSRLDIIRMSCLYLGPARFMYFVRVFLSIFNTNKISRFTESIASHNAPAC